MKTIEFTEDEIKFLLEMINTLNFPGRVAEQVFEIKRKLKEDNPKKENANS